MAQLMQVQPLSRASNRERGRGHRQRTLTGPAAQVFMLFSSV